MDNQRLILLLVFFFSVVMLWDAWQKQGQPRPGPTAPATQGASASGGNTVPIPTAAMSPASSPASTPGSAAVPAAATEQVVQAASKQSIKTDLFIAEISAQGGDLTRLELIRHR